MTYRLMIRNFYEQEARKDLYSQPVVIFGAGEAGVITYKTLQKELKKHY